MNKGFELFKLTFLKLLFSFKGTLMQILKSADIFFFT